tara:strand:- start:317 stop:631 length:315 start_codon:yes stop_codon:yes gene_type:complete
MKNLFLLLLVILTSSCQREKMNEIGVGYNESLIIPPSNDLPVPGSVNNKSSDIPSNEDSLVNSILDQTDAIQADDSIIDKIDHKSGYKTDENFFQWLFKGKSKR